MKVCRTEMAKFLGLSHNQYCMFDRRTKLIWCDVYERPTEKKRLQGAKNGKIRLKSKELERSETECVREKGRSGK